MTTIDEMVNRFLGWRLPDSFSPDCGISFKPLGHPNGWPIGTNLLTATEARAMLEHVAHGATQFCWLVENGKQAGDGLAYRYMDQGLPLWTTDPQRAMRFARREDAEMFAAEDEDAWRIVEHGFET